MVPKSHDERSHADSMDDFTDAEIREIHKRWRSWFEGELARLSDGLAEVKADREKYNAFLDMLIKREEKRQAFMDRLIADGVRGIIWSAFVAAGALVWLGLKSEGAMFVDAVKAMKK